MKKRNLIKGFADPFNHYRLRIRSIWEGIMKKLSFLFLSAILVVSCSNAKESSDDPLDILNQRRREYQEKQREKEAEQARKAAEISRMTEKERNEYEIQRIKEKIKEMK